MQHPSPHAESERSEGSGIRHPHATLALYAALAALSLPATAQSSSLATTPHTALQRTDRYHTDSAYEAAANERLLPGIAEYSSFAVPAPPPITYAENDLVTIIIRESMQTDLDADLETTTESTFNDRISALPNFNLSDLLDLQLGADGVTTPLRVGIDSSHEFTGEGDFSRRNAVTGRITARVVEVLPNGTLVLEARKHLEHDGESLTIAMTGTCRVDDIDRDNAVLSTDLYNLRLIQENQGELRRATRKGWLTRLGEAIFNF